jgi:hypothetical protein
VSIRKRGSRSYQVGVAPFPAETVPTRDAAERLELDLKLRRLGRAASPERPTTLGDEIDGYLSRLRAAGGLSVVRGSENPSLSSRSAARQLAGSGVGPLRLVSR